MEENFMVEGEKLIREGIRSGLQLHTLFIEEGRETEWEDALEVALVTPRLLMKKLSNLENAPTIIGFFIRKTFATLNDVVERYRNLIILDRIQDPGNLGTILRSCEALEADAVILLQGTCSPWNSKAVRAAMGSSFRLPIVSDIDEEILFSRLREHDFCCLAADTRGTQLWGFRFPDKTALFFGTEGAGLSPNITKRCSETLRIPMTDRVESLNVSTSVAICLYERLRSNRNISIVQAPLT